LKVFLSRIFQEEKMSMQIC
jgi:hypothetical protein